MFISFNDDTIMVTSVNNLYNRIFDPLIPSQKLEIIGTQDCHDMDVLYKCV